MNQSKAIINHLMRHESISSMEAFELYGATRLASIIFRLRHIEKWNIETRIHQIKNRYGHNVNYARYYLKEEK